MKRVINNGQIRVLTPQTTDGVNVAFGDDEKIVYKETILPASARKHLESLNANLPTQLRSKIQDIKPEAPKTQKPEAPAAPPAPAPPKAPGGKKKKADPEDSNPDSQSDPNDSGRTDEQNA